MDGPIVKLKDGSVLKVNTPEEAKKIYSSVQEIVYLGDILVPYGDFANRNHVLEPAGYEENYWAEHLEKAGGKSDFLPDFSCAVNLSREFKIPLHPNFIFYWREISREHFLGLLDWISRGAAINQKVVLPFTASDRERFSNGKRALELIGCEHQVTIENVVIKSEEARALLFNLGLDIQEGNLENIFEKTFLKVKEKIKEENIGVLDLVNFLCEVKIMDKSGTFIGARMGRPEKAKLRKLIGSPHVLFPVGDEGGKMRNLIVALEKGRVTAEFANYSCSTCNRETVYPRCEVCFNFCKKKVVDESEEAPRWEKKEQRLEIRTYFEEARKRLKLRNDEIPLVVKGVRGTSNKDHSCEYLGKGFLRARHNLHVNKDGTIRYDMTEMPITHFRPGEIGTSVEKLKEMGYETDVDGKKLIHENQLLEMFPHDIILPSCPDSPDERADDVFLNVSKFLDEEFEKIYDVGKFFNFNKKEELIGQLFGCMAPHTCSATVGRLIGFSKVQALLAPPYIHAAMRRDCDGDEAAVMMLMDLLINFSRSFIPSHRGGTQDAPLVLNLKIKANEVDDMIFDLDVFGKIPLGLYEAAEKNLPPSSVKVEQLKSRLGGDREFVEVNFTHDSSDINSGVLCSSYKILPTMQDKVNEMMSLCEKIRAVDTSDVARLIIERHFIRDTRGNLRKFSMQGFRCVGCNEKFRRPPLTGKCSNCGGKLIFTIAEGSILKYLQPALDLAKKYKVSAYLLQNLELTEMYIQSIFGREKEKQEALGKWF